MPFIFAPVVDVVLIVPFSLQKMEVELNAEREKLLADKTLVETELKTVNEDLTNKLTAAESQVGDFRCYI